MRATLAAYAPIVAIMLSGGSVPAAPTAISATMTQASGEAATRAIEAKLPGAIGFNADFALKGCSAADERAHACPESARIGTIEAESAFGPAKGALYLTEDFRLAGVVEAYNLFRFDVQGVLQVLPGQEVVVRFDGLPDIATTRMQLKMLGGERTPLALPRACGTYAIAYVLTGHDGTTVKGSHPFTVSGCRTLPRIASVHVAGGVLRWQLPQPVAHTEVLLRRLRAGAWYELGAVRVPGERLRVGRRWRGRALAPGRYALVVTAVAADGTRSLSQTVRWRIR